MTDRFEDSRMRIAWAKKDIAKFERCAYRFFQRTPYAVVTEPDTDGIHEFHKLRLAKNLPAVLTEHTVSAIENLRSALDLTASNVARLSKAPNPGDIHFPFSKTRADFKSRINSSACKPLPAQIKMLFECFKPYGGGDNLLWAINELCNTSKHRLILPVATKSGVNFPSLETSDIVRKPIIIMEGIQGCTENEVVFAKTQIGLKWKYRVQIAFGVAFGKIKPIEGADVFPIISEMVKIATRIVDESQVKCHNLGLAAAL